MLCCIGRSRMLDFMAVGVVTVLLIPHFGLLWFKSDYSLQNCLTVTFPMTQITKIFCQFGLG